jgi:hypothetical protein
MEVKFLKEFKAFKERKTIKKEFQFSPCISNEIKKIACIILLII